MVPRVRDLEERFPDELVVIGVHSGKYPAERMTERIRTACARLGIGHPVVNDSRFRLWRAYAVSTWPTLILIAPDGSIANSQSGEVSTEQLIGLVRRFVGEAEVSGTLRRRPPRPKQSHGHPSGPLRFPGRILADGDRLFVSDTGNHRVLELVLEHPSPAGGRSRARILRSWGTGRPGFSDGGRSAAAFREPQGLALTGGTLWVADRGNHAIRAVHLVAGDVSTAVGTTEEDPGPVLRSPWGLAVLDGTLLVTVAGSHQLWSLSLDTGDLDVIAGTGIEDITDGSALFATLAQPMGAVAHDGSVYFADSESSAIRELTPETTVRTIVGTGLFNHGDRDGTGNRVKLQHPQDVTWHRERLLVADSYNNKLKLVDPVTRTAKAVRGEAGSGLGLSEPSGVWADDDRILVADTNAHRIVGVDPETGAVSEIEIG